MRVTQIAFLAIAITACRLEWGAPQRTTSSSAAEGRVTVYTSAYPRVVQGLQEKVKVALPTIDVQWFQAGSEKIAARFEAELAAGEPSADLLMTSDPIFFAGLKSRGALLPYASLRTLKLDRAWLDGDGAFVTCRVSLVGFVTKTGTPAPRTWAELADPKWKGRVTMPDPLASGTAFTTVAAWYQALGPKHLLALRANQVSAAGGGTAAVERLLRGEADVAVALYENAALAREQGADVTFSVPEGGGVAVAGGLAWVKKGQRSNAVASVYDWLLSSEAQAVFREGALHSPFAEEPLPLGAPALPPPPTLADFEQVRTAWRAAFH